MPDTGDVSQRMKWTTFWWKKMSQNNTRSRIRELTQEWSTIYSPIRWAVCRKTPWKIRGPSIASSVALLNTTWLYLNQKLIKKLECPGTITLISLTTYIFIHGYYIISSSRCERNVSSYYLWSQSWIQYIAIARMLIIQYRIFDLHIPRLIIVCTMSL